MYSERLFSTLMTNSNPLAVSTIPAVPEKVPQTCDRDATYDRNVPQSVPQQYAKSGTACTYALHARTFFLSDFVSIENKETINKIPKLVIRVKTRIFLL